MFVKMLNFSGDRSIKPHLNLIMQIVFYLNTNVIIHFLENYYTIQEFGSSQPSCKERIAVGWAPRHIVPNFSSPVLITFFTEPAKQKFFSKISFITIHTNRNSLSTITQKTPKSLCWVAAKMDIPRSRSMRSTSLRDTDSRLTESERIEGAGSWDAIEWTKIDVNYWIPSFI